MKVRTIRTEAANRTAEFFHGRISPSDPPEKVLEVLTDIFLNHAVPDLGGIQSLAVSVTFRDNQDGEHIHGIVCNVGDIVHLFQMNLKTLTNLVEADPGVGLMMALDSLTPPRRDRSHSN